MRNYNVAIFMYIKFQFLKQNVLAEKYAGENALSTNAIFAVLFAQNLVVLVRHIGVTIGEVQSATFGDPLFCPLHF